MKPEKKSNQQDIQSTLNRIKLESAQDKKKIAMNILTSKPKAIPKIQYRKLIKQKLLKSWNYWNRQTKIQQNKHMIAMTCFLIVSTYMCWKIQSKYDNMRNKATKTKSFKQQAIQKQNQYITKMLNKTQFQSIPIPKDQQQINIYKYQENSQSLLFDTKDQLLETMAEDYKKGQNNLLSEYQQQLKKRKMI